MERSIFLFLRAANEQFKPKERAIVASPKVRNRSDLGVSNFICEKTLFYIFERDDLFGTESETIIQFLGFLARIFFNIKAPSNGSYCMIRYKPMVQLMCIKISLGDI